MTLCTVRFLFPTDRRAVGRIDPDVWSKLNLDGTKVVGQESLPIGSRVRDVVQGPDGLLYVLTDEDNGQLLRIEPE